MIMEKEKKVKCGKIDILGIPIDMVSMNEAMEAFEELMTSSEKGMGLIATPNSEFIVAAQKDPAFGDILRSADLVIPDGIGLVYASKILGCPLTERVTGIDFLTRILERLEKEGKSIFLLGSKPGDAENPGVAELAAQRMKEKHPGLHIAGTHHGYFDRDEEDSVVEEINRSGADFLCIALGSPKQEEFAWRNKNILTPKAAIGVGGSLDVWAGTVKRAPEFYQKHGIEWLYRFVKQPSRINRMAALPLFILKILFSDRK